MAAPAVAEFEDIGKVYPAGLFGSARVVALEHVSLRIHPGEVFALVGPNRAGKTTLVKILLSLCRPTTGRGFRFQRPLAERQTLARVGYVHERPAFPGYLSARALLEYYGALAFLPEPVVKRRAPELLDRVSLADRVKEPISGFSKGMLQRLAIAQALMNDPDLLVLDEPSEGLDLAGRRLVRDIIDERRRRGLSVLLVSHLLGELAQLCDRLGVLVGGHLVYCGSVADLAGDRTAESPSPLEPALDRLYRGLPLPPRPRKTIGERGPLHELSGSHLCGPLADS
jgi:ABC-2 type transport system ATP-binding protein